MVWCIWYHLVWFGQYLVINKANQLIMSRVTRLEAMWCLDINKLAVSSYPIWYLVNSVCISQAHLIIPLLLADQGGNWYCYHLGLGLLKFQR